MRIEDARLYLVVDARPDVVEAALRGGVDAVQLRMKEAADDEVVEAGRELRLLCDTQGALLIVNDRPDLALACGADGVHVGQEDAPVSEARSIVGPDRIVGLSTHSPEQIAAPEGADYIAVGPVFATPTKPGRPAVGLALVREAARSARVPWFAIGGIDATSIDEVVAAGATRIAVVRAIADAPDPEAAARELASRLRRAGTPAAP